MPSLRSAVDLSLDIHGVGVRVRSDDPAALDALARDFAYFTRRDSPGDDAGEIIVRLHAAPAPAFLSEPGPWWPGRKLRWRDRSGVRLVRYDAGELVRWNPSEGAGDVYSERPQRLHELGYLLILSKVGERLDAEGLHRVHALGFELEGSAGLVLLPSGGGKTSLSLALRQAPGLRFLSEDTPLLDARGGLHAFPLRWGLRDRADAADIPPRWVRPFERERHGLKWLVDVDYFAGRLAARAPVRWVFVGSRRPGRPAGVQPLAPWRAAGALALNLVVGWGVPQMAEYALSAAAAPDLARAALRRCAAALHLLKSAPCALFELGASPQEAADALIGYLAAQNRV